MKTCTNCGRDNEDHVTKCQECGAEFTGGPASAKDTPKEHGEGERFEKIAVLDNEVQAELMDGILSGREIPHILQSYYDSALNGIFQTGKGWGVILAPAPFREEILAALADVRQQVESSSDAPEGSS